MESGRRTRTRHGGIGFRSGAPVADYHRWEKRGESKVVDCTPMDPRSPMRLSSAEPMCRATLPITRCEHCLHPGPGPLQGNTTRDVASDAVSLERVVPEPCPAGIHANENGWLMTPFCIRPPKLGGATIRSQTSAVARIRARDVWHGRQYFASSSSEFHFKERAHLRSYSGADTASVLCGCTTSNCRSLVLETLRVASAAPAWTNLEGTEQPVPFETREHWHGCAARRAWRSDATLTSGTSTSQSLRIKSIKNNIWSIRMCLLQPNHFWNRKFLRHFSYHLYRSLLNKNKFMMIWWYYNSGWWYEIFWRDVNIYSRGFFSFFYF